MWNFFEQPWTLAGMSVLVLLGVLTYRSVWDERRRWWQWLLPVGVAALGFGLDYAVATDLEKINGTIRTSMAAAEQEDCVALARLLAADYEDSYHTSKQALIDHCRQRLVPPAVEQIRKVAAAVTVTPPQAVATLTMRVKFEPDSHWARTAGKTGVLVKAQFRLRKQSGGHWLVTRIEVLEVDMMPVNWGMA
ncbi:MAG: hypothetical protein A2Y76_07185 [Planctomycetes bacterium RBG_13_60_9]|nr:MAG: hypothetical protein A2Y76_07185 [Planctomycetes bacterium RBG_13_60_9]